MLEKVENTHIFILKLEQRASGKFHNKYALVKPVKSATNIVDNITPPTTSWGKPP
jgi:hypothetical protein